jgi:hypothetical protein
MWWLNWDSNPGTPQREEEEEEEEEEEKKKRRRREEEEEEKKKKKGIHPLSAAGELTREKRIPLSALFLRGSVTSPYTCIPVHQQQQRSWGPASQAEFLSVMVNTSFLFCHLCNFLFLRLPKF